MKSIWLLGLVVALNFGDLAAQPAPSPSRQFKPFLDHITLADGDTFVFLGDSITHQCLYTQYLEDYFYCRHPDTRIHFHNAGVGGDQAHDALLRFDEDVAAFKPKYITILLGMNDGHYTDFKPDVFDAYQRDMTELLNRIRDLGSTAILVTPTRFDARTARRRKPKEPRDTYYNGVLALYGAWVREQASIRGLGLVDMYSPLNNFTMQVRKREPTFTFIPDAIHPGPAGHAIMAAAFLDDVVTDGPVFELTLEWDRQAETVQQQAVNCRVRNLKCGDELDFDLRANSLPWVLPPAAERGYSLTHAGHRHSLERLTIVGLPYGNYDLRIDDRSVGIYTSTGLAEGLELEANPQTPDYQQALEVARLNQERNQKAVHLLRNQWLRRKAKRREEAWLAAHPNDPKAPARRIAFQAWLKSFHQNVAKLQDLARDYENRIYRINRPKTHHYELRREKI